MQHHMTEAGVLLRPDGSLAQTGYALRGLLRFNRAAARSFPLRLKEWDFYQIHNGDWILQLVIGHVSYAGNLTATLFNIRTGERRSCSRLVPLVRNGFRMEDCPEADYELRVQKNGFYLCFTVSNGGTVRRLFADCTDAGGERCTAELTLTCAPDAEKMVVATPFFRKNEFFYNFKQNGMKANGIAVFGGQTVAFEDAFALIDWGRGVWPFAHSWYWGNAGGQLADGRQFALNLGWGFGDTGAATENMLFVDGRAHKLDILRAEFNERDFLRPMAVTSNDGRFTCTFTPVYDNYTETKLLFVDTSCHQVFGWFDGTSVLDGGESVALNRIFGFIERAQNRW